MACGTSEDESEREDINESSRSPCEKRLASVSTMDEYTADAFVNRDDPIPVLEPAGNEAQPAEPQAKGKRDRLKDSLADQTTKLKEKVTESEGTKYGYSLQDRLFAK